MTRERDPRDQAGADLERELAKLHAETADFARQQRRLTRRVLAGIAIYLAFLALAIWQGWL